ncbi:hypothetical protein L1987_60548 [Smallanthus sonchifolius]|uniref:Uncharacterized protein n=1 Tax=Smallanthus sonchifolius TaxID=185202 RepID=A0ACB9D8E8_9ASTR|nr:hypothetical protein L1987_60548 [Smallanthus sonchifolius]
MDPESVINLYDSCWFNHEILKNNRNVSCAKTSKPDLKYSSLRSILVRSQSEDVGNSFNYGSFSPNSVLKTIPSGKLDFTPHKQEHEQEQVVEDQESEAAKKDDQMEMKMQMKKKKKKKKKRRPGGTSKSLSDLEFEELKGFMDMGFVFSEQDKDSRLVEIIPGLQRLGHADDVDDDDDDDDDGDDDDDDERRPYLSEAWEDMDRKLKKEAPIMKWEIPVVRDEIDMKDNLKLWAHTVASYVR